jgi:hypothetical protein
MLTGAASRGRRGRRRYGIFLMRARVGSFAKLMCGDYPAGDRSYAARQVGSPPDEKSEWVDGR